MTESPNLSVVIVTRNRREEVGALLADLRSASPGPGDRIVVVDNGSTDGTVAAIRERHPEAAVVAQAENRGAPAARNAGVAAAGGEVLILLDDDVRIEDGEFFPRIRRLFAGAPEMAVAALGILDPQTRRPRRFEIPLRRKDPVAGPAETSYFISAGCAVRREAWEALGGMDESLVYGFEELDFSYRAVERGFRIFYHPEVRVLHALSPSGRPAGRRIYYFLRNKIWISARYLPWPMVTSQLLVWSGYFLKEAIRIGRIDLFFAALGAGVAGIPARRRRNDRISRPALRRLADLDGRLYY